MRSLTSLLRRYANSPTACLLLRKENTPTNPTVIQIWTTKGTTKITVNGIFLNDLAIYEILNMMPNRFRQK